MKNHVRVAAIAPFWRYAVGPTNGRNLAIPFYRYASAVKFFEEVKRDLPFGGVCLYQRRGFRSLETIQEYTPSPDAFEKFIAGNMRKNHARRK